MGTHRMHADRRLRIGWLPVLLAFSALLVLLLAGAAFAGYRYDRASSSRILPGVSIAGVDVGGMARDRAMQALQPVSRGLLDRTIAVRAGNRTWTVSAGSLGTKVAVEQAVSDAMALQDSFGWPSRVYHRLLQRPVTKDIPLTVKQNRSAVSKFAQGIAADIARPAQDASIDLVDNQLVAVPSKPGASVSASNIRAALLRALQNGRSQVDAKVKTVAPAVTEKDLGMTIVIRTTTNKLYLYHGVKLVKTYDVATGQPQYATPLGHFEIINKRVNPTWINPALDTWGKNLPAMIPPGPGNPLGTRALDLNAPGIRIHGTPDDASIGTAASHGCIRMHIPESEELFDRVDVGTQVFIAP